MYSRLLILLGAIAALVFSAGGPDPFPSIDDRLEELLTRCRALDAGVDHVAGRGMESLNKAELRIILAASHPKSRAALRDALIARIDAEIDSPHDAYLISVVAAFEEATGDHVAVGAAPYCSARREEREGRLDAALIHYGEAERLFAEAEAPEWRALHGKGTAYLRSEKHDQAVAALRESLSIRRSLYADEHAVVADTLHGLALCFTVRNALDDSLALHRQTLAMRIKLFGDVHSDVAQSLTEIADVHARRGEHSSALECCRRLTTLQKTRFGPNDSRTIGPLRMTGECYRRLERFAEAEAVIREALGIAEQSGRAEELQAAECICDLALIYKLQNRIEAALEDYLRSWEIEWRVRGPLGAETLKTQRAIGRCHFELGRYAEARRIYQEVVEARESISEKDSRALARILYDIGSVYQELRAWEHALNYYSRTWEIEKKLRGRNDSETLVTRRQIGHCQRKVARFAAAQATLAEVLDGRRATFGNDDAQVALSLYNLGLTHELQNR
jgi:tetratricopeptide (TPR) repeat protein